MVKDQKSSDKEEKKSGNTRNNVVYSQMVKSQKSSDKEKKVKTRTS